MKKPEVQICASWVGIGGSDLLLEMPTDHNAAASKQRKLGIGDNADEFAASYALYSGIERHSILICTIIL